MQSTYWTRWVMGVISGIVLSQIVYDFFLHSGNDTTAQAAPAAIGQPLLALLGGYSVDFVHGILKRAINTVGNFFGVAMGGVDNQRAGAAETLAQKKISDGHRTRRPAACSGTESRLEDVRKRLDGLVQRITPKAG